MKNNRLNLIYKLNHIMNQNEIGTVEYQLAKFFLDHFQSIQQLNIYDIAEENHVSRSTIRRFAKQLDYENFADMKNQISNFDDGIQRYEAFYNREQFIPELTKNIERLMAELSVRMNNQETDRLVNRMNNKEEVIIICSSNIAGIVKTFQHQMIVLGKRITLLTSTDDMAKYKNIHPSETPLIIVFSISGLFLSSILSELKEIEGEKILFTINRDPVYNQLFEKIYHLCSQDFSGVSDLLYYTYGVTFVFDILFNGFMRKKKECEKNAF